MAVLLGLTACGTRTGPSEPLAATPGNLLPWLAGGELHDGDVVVPTQANRLVLGSGTTLAGRTDGARSRWWLLDHDRLVPLLDEPAASVDPVLSADGGTAAWIAGGVVTAYDVPSRTVLGRTSVSEPVAVAVVANDGRVALDHGPGGAVLMWRAGDDPVPASWRDFGGPPKDGAIRSPDETLAAGPDLVIRDLRTGERTTLKLTPDRRWSVRMWADDVHVLVARGGEGSTPDVVSCDATTGECATP
jgi:hypothetical protein